MNMLILSILLAGIAIVLAYMSRWEALAIAWAALACAIFSHLLTLGVSAVVFWGIATALVMGIYAMLPAEVRKAKAGVPYLCTGALVGAVLGMIVATQAAIILGCAIGIVLGAIAFGRMGGKALGYPSKKFFNYALAKGFQALVVFSMLGLLLCGLINKV